MAIYELDGVAPQLPASGQYWIADNAAVIGKVVLGENVSVWFSAVLRGDNEYLTIGDDSNIQDCCVLHTDMGYPLVVGKGVTAGHQATLHGCTIGDNTLIGMGATVMNGAVVGDNCLIGANTLIPENKQIPDNSLVVGSPGKIIRTIGDDVVEQLRISASSYAQKARRFKDGLTEIS